MAISKLCRNFQILIEFLPKGQRIVTSVLHFLLLLALVAFVAKTPSLRPQNIDNVPTSPTLPARSIPRGFDPAHVCNRYVKEDMFTRSKMDVNGEKACVYLSLPIVAYSSYFTRV